MVWDARIANNPKRASEMQMRTGEQLCAINYGPGQNRIGDPPGFKISLRYAQHRLCLSNMGCAPHVRSIGFMVLTHSYTSPLLLILGRSQSLSDANYPSVRMS